MLEEASKRSGSQTLELPFGRTFAGPGLCHSKCTTVISACSKGTEWEAAVALIRNMPVHKVQPDAICYAAAAESVSDEGFTNGRGALAMLRELWSKRLQPERESLRAAALEIAGTTASLADSTRSTAEGSLQGIIDDVLSCSEDGSMGVWLFNATILRAQTSRAVYRLLTSMEEHGISRVPPTYSAAIGACGRAHDWPAALQLLCDMRGGFTDNQDPSKPH
eukprot:s6385_g2.t1